MKAIEVLDGLWIRGRLNSALTTQQAVAELKELGITSVLSVHPQGDTMLLGQNEIDYKHVPLSDGKKIPDVIEELADWVYERVPSTLVMCRAGRNRSGLIVALTIMRIKKVSGPVALDVLRNKRPRAIANPAFEKYLLGLEAPKGEM